MNNENLERNMEVILSVRYEHLKSREHIRTVLFVTLIKTKSLRYWNDSIKKVLFMETFATRFTRILWWKRTAVLGSDWWISTASGWGGIGEIRYPRNVYLAYYCHWSQDFYYLVAHYQFSIQGFLSLTQSTSSNPSLVIPK